MKQNTVSLSAVKRRMQLLYKLQKEVINSSAVEDVSAFVGNETEPASDDW